MHAHIPNDPGEMGMQSHAQERGCLYKDEGLCGLVRACVCVYVSMFMSTGELIRKHGSSGRQKFKLCATRRCECPVVQRAAISREKERALVHRTEPACVHLDSMWERVLIFNYIILPIP